MAELTVTEGEGVGETTEIETEGCDDDADEPEEEEVVVDGAELTTDGVEDEEEAGTEEVVGALAELTVLLAGSFPLLVGAPATFSAFSVFCSLFPAAVLTSSFLSVFSCLPACAG